MKSLNETVVIVIKIGNAKDPIPITNKKELTPWLKLYKFLLCY